ncbi:MAG: transcriptional repressor [Chloroflexi bacterium]|nr:transcriptional repressor [Chloroflexota bacterium]
MRVLSIEATQPYYSESLQKHQILKRTKQKEAILTVLRNTTFHPTAIWIFEVVRKEIPNISLATVYRNLKQLAERDQVLELQFDGSMSHFDGRTDKHSHFICDDCGCIFDVDETGNELSDQIARKTGLKISHYRLVFHGVCRMCQTNQTIKDSEDSKRKETG